MGEQEQLGRISIRRGFKASSPGIFLPGTRPRGSSCLGWMFGRLVGSFSYHRCLIVPNNDDHPQVTALSSEGSLG